MYLQYACKKPVSLYPALQWFNQPKIGAEWLFNGTGVGASNQFEAGGSSSAAAQNSPGRIFSITSAGGD